MTNIEHKDLNKANDKPIAGYQLFAIEKRYEGWSAPDISLELEKKYKIKVPDSTIRYWFYKKGPLAGYYRNYADLRIRLELEETHDFIKGNVSKAAKVLARVMAGKGGMPQVAAAQIFLERGLGKVGEKIEHSGTVGVAMIDILKAIKEAKKNGDNEQKDTKNSESAG